MVLQLRDGILGVEDDPLHCEDKPSSCRVRVFPSLRRLLTVFGPSFAVLTLYQSKAKRKK
jgi:hypothetical protein